MKLSEVFNQLAYGELSQLAMIDEGTGLIATKRYPQLISHVNLGLTALYKRFLLKENRLTFKLVKDMMTYPLNTDYGVEFIETAADGEFNNDILKIESVFTDAGYEVSLNDRSNVYACSTPSAAVLRVPAAFVTNDPDLPEYYKTTTLSLVYRANHPVIVYSTGFNPANVDIELPISHLEALLLFVASRLNNPIGMTNEFHAGNSYAGKYEKACQELELHDLKVDQGSQNTRLIGNGWV